MSRSKQPNSLRLGTRGGDHGRKSETLVAKKLGARLTPASGALRGGKGDSTTADVMYESKSTVHDSMGVELAWLVKVTEQALAVGKSPALTMSFVTGDGKPRKNGEWVCVPVWRYRELMGD